MEGKSSAPCTQVSGVRVAIVPKPTDKRERPLARLAACPRRLASCRANAGGSRCCLASGSRTWALRDVPALPHASETQGQAAGRWAPGTRPRCAAGLAAFFLGKGPWAFAPK